MRILLTNDDGIHAIGIRTLYKYIKDIAQVTVVAPDRNNSAASSSLTLARPLRITKLEENFYSVDGTPADCTHLALNGFLKDKIDLVVSGINAGANLGDDVLYSGTVAAALEGRYLNIPSIAVSLVGNKYFTGAAEFIKNLIPKIHLLKLASSQEILNINVPDIRNDEIKGHKIVKLGKRYAGGEIIEQRAPIGDKVYWIGKTFPGDISEENDFLAIQEGFISITPICIDMTSYKSFNSIHTWLNNL